MIPSSQSVLSLTNYHSPFWGNPTVFPLHLMDARRAFLLRPRPRLWQSLSDWKMIVGSVWDLNRWRKRNKHALFRNRILLDCGGFYSSARGACWSVPSSKRLHWGLCDSGCVPCSSQRLFSIRCYPEDNPGPRQFMFSRLCDSHINCLREWITIEANRRFMLLELFIEIDMHSSKCRNSSKILLFWLKIAIDYIWEWDTTDSNWRFIFLELSIESICIPLNFPHCAALRTVVIDKKSRPKEIHGFWDCPFLEAIELRAQSRSLGGMLWRVLLSVNSCCSSRLYYRHKWNALPM
jgi:hypothetical protein